MNITLIIVAIIAFIFTFITGVLIGREYESRQFMEMALDDFAETEHLRSENVYLKKKLGMMDDEEVENGTE